MLAAYAAFHGILDFGIGSDFNYALAGLAAAASIVAVNHLLMAPMLHLARGHSMRESGLFSFPSLSTDLVLAMLGVAMAAFWTANPWLIPVRRRSVAADPPLAERPAVAGGGARRPEDRPLQREALRARAERGVAARRALRAAALPGDGRPRPAARHQQHLRASRRRRGAPGHRRNLPLASAPLRRPRALRRRGVRDPAPGDHAGAGLRDRRADPAHGCRQHLRRRDLQRADPSDGLDRRRRVPARRGRRQRADPPGRPGRLPRQAPGTQPRPRRELGAAVDAGEAPEPARGGPRGRRPHRAAASSRRKRPRPRAPSPTASRHARPALPVALAPACDLRRDRQRGRPRGRHARRDLRPQHGLARAARARRAGRRRPGARARGRRRLDLG